MPVTVKILAGDASAQTCFPFIATGAIPLNLRGGFSMNFIPEPAPARAAGMDVL